MTVYVRSADGGRDAVLDVFNLATYEAVPYLADDEVVALAAPATRIIPGAKYGTAHVAARFLLLELWTIQLLWRMEKVSPQYGQQQSRRLLERFRALEPALSRNDLVFPSSETHYLGQIESARLAAKRAVRDSRTQAASAPTKRKWRPAPYYPARSRVQAAAASVAAEGGDEDAEAPYYAARRVDDGHQDDPYEAF